MSRRILFIGLDAVPDKLLFNDLIDDLPNISDLLRKGVYGTLRSCDPPITVPAWTVMMSSKDPGTLGIYGFRHRRGNGYTDPWIVNSGTVKEMRVWEILGNYGKRSTIVGLPPAYPPFRLNGKLVSCFLTPKGAEQYTYPPELKRDIESLVQDYKFDVIFRTEDRKTILDDIYDMTKKRFMVVQELSKYDDWDFFMFMEIGTDRLHHAFWKYYDETHPKYVENNEYESVIPDYYRFLDQKIGELLLSVANDNTIIIIASDHGTKAMNGALCINEWLIKEGFLVLKNYPEKVIDIESADVDWERTTAWGWGGYYARIFLNVQGREPLGKIKKDDYESIRETLAEKIRNITDPAGKEMDTRVLRPEEAYKNVVGDKPDLMVYFDNLFWRSAGTIGHNTMYLSENDTGPDDSVHSHNGIFIMYDPQLELRGRVDLSIYDVAPTILDLLGIAIRPDMQGRSIVSNIL
ncbi:MAG: nucleotide pyrophosphatase [Nitrososphaeraceae archaeon]|nr:nucleotide pyrophosphatase [Nitrososphaeraceae archaeon]